MLLPILSAFWEGLSQWKTSSVTSSNIVFTSPSSSATVSGTFALQGWTGVTLQGSGTYTAAFSINVNTVGMAEGLTSFAVGTGLASNSRPFVIKNSSGSSTAGMRFNNFFGVNTHIGWPQGNSLNPQTPGAVVSRCIALGAKSMRADAGGAGQMSVIAVNCLNGGLASAGIELYPVLQVISNGWNPQTQNESQSYALGYSMGFACANRISGQCKVIECGNELDAWKVDQSGSFKIAGSGSHNTDWNQAYWASYRGVHRGMIDGVRAASEGHLVAVNIGVPMAFPCLEMLWNGTEPNGTSGQAQVRWDITSYHWYHSYGNILAAGGPSDNPKINVLSKAAQFGKPIFLTEIGWNGGSEGNTSASASASVYMNSALSQYYSLRVTYDIERTHWYVLYDPGYGLISTDGVTVTAAFNTFKAFVSAHASLSA